MATNSLLVIALPMDRLLAKPRRKQEIQAQENELEAKVIGLEDGCKPQNKITPAGGSNQDTQLAKVSSSPKFVL